MPLAVLSIDLVAKLASLEQGMDRAGRLAEKQAAQIERSFSGLKVAAAGLGGVIAGAFSVTAIQQFFVATVDGLDALNDLKDATGASIENISALEDVALRTGSSFETVSAALVKLNGVLKDAKPGSGAAETLKAIGLSAEELKRIDPAEAMLKVAQALSGFADDANKARIVQELFGKSIQEVAPLLKDLAEKGQLVATVTTEQAQAAETFNKQLAELQKNTVDVARSLTGPLISAINDTIQKFKDGAKEGKNFFANTRDLQLQAFGVDTSAAGRRSQQIRDLEDALKRPGLNANARQQFEQDLAKLRTQQQQARAAEVFEDGFVGSDTLKPTVGGIPGKPGKEQKQRAERPAFVGPELPEATKAAIDALSSSDLAKAKQITAAVAELDSLFASGRVDAQEYAAAIEKLRGKDVAGPILPDEEVARIKRLNELLAATPTAQLEATRREMEFLAESFEKGSITAEQFTEAAQARLGTLPEKFEKAADEMTAFSEEAARNIQDALGDTVLATLEGDFDSIEDSWKRMLNRLVSEAIAADIGKALFGNGKPSLEGAAGQIGKLFGGASSLFDGVAGAIGTYFGAENPSSAYAVNGSDFGFSLADIPSYDVGTPYVPQDTLALVHRGERITPAAQNRPGAVGPGGTVIHNSPQIYIDGRMDQASTAQLISQALQANNRALEERMNAQGRR
jgi:hypothetical protein